MDGQALLQDPLSDRRAFAELRRRGAVSAPEPVPPGPEDPAALIAAIAARGDRQAFARLFSSYAPRVKTYLLRRGMAPQRAEELAQETLLAVWRKADQFDAARAGAPAWIFTIARNLAIDAHRRARPLLPGFAEDPSVAPPASAAPDAALYAHELDMQLQEAMRSLPAEQQAVVRLSFFSDKPHSEIAAELGVPLGTVKSRLRLAFVRLRACLEDFR